MYIKLFTQIKANDCLVQNFTGNPNLQSKIELNFFYCCNKLKSIYFNYKSMKILFFIKRKRL